MKLKLKEMTGAAEYFKTIKFDALSPHYHKDYFALSDALDIDR